MFKQSVDAQLESGPFTVVLQKAPKVNFSFNEYTTLCSTANLVIEAQGLPWQIQQPSFTSLRGRKCCLIPICLVKQQRPTRKLIFPQSSKSGAM